ncbi:MAG TPA: alpha-hydroxy acid oxidase [Stellaceae bacterium]|jgi:glycolate oxidase|nr:alpha-hydroxy acid oxidase [Stellaceae bacterium]
MAEQLPDRPPAPTAEQIAEVTRRFLTTTELVAEARRKLHPHSWDFVAGGSETEATLARNRLALDVWALRPRVLRDVLQESIDPSSNLLGIKLRIPVLFAPVGGMTMLDPHGALGPVRAAAQFGTMTFISSVTEPDIDRAAAHANGRLVLQLYIRGDANWVDAYVERAATVGCRAICFTVDTDAYSRRERNQLNRFFSGGPLVTGGRTGVMENTGREHQERFNWKDIERVRKKFDLPIIIKGIATAEDAKIAVDHGAAVVYVSNHGGRQLDHGQGTLEMLPPVVEAVNGHADVVIDGGFVRGTDIIKAVALGAKAVGIGKLQAWALAAGGEAAMILLLNLLEEEITKDLMLMGLTKLTQVDRSVLVPAQPVTWPTALSAFPHLDRYK